MPKILVIDDDILMCEMLKNQLEANSFQVITADNGKTGVRSALTDKPDLIIVDMYMPEMNGLETIQNIKQEDALKKIPIIVASGEANKDAIFKVIKAGASDYILKPYKPELLTHKISEILELVR